MFQRVQAVIDIKIKIKKTAEITSEELQFKDGNPGAVQYGNFINYYQFHPPEMRVDLLPTDIWLTTTCTASDPGGQNLYIQEKNLFLALDIGCNAGNLTNSLLKFLRKALPKRTKIKILAVDIDAVLVERAKEQFQTDCIQFHHADCTKSDFKQLVKDFLSKNSSTKQKFDATFCFSTTMWIHLNHGDQGLLAFLKDISERTQLLVIEPQPWKCYKNALKRMNDHIVFPFFKDLKLRYDVEDDIVNYLKDLNMSIVFESRKSAWTRKVFIFRYTIQDGAK